MDNEGPNIWGAQCILFCITSTVHVILALIRRTY